MAKYQRDPNKDYKIIITMAELDASISVSGEFKFSQVNEMADKFNINTYAIIANTLISELEQQEAKRLGQIYTDKWDLLDKENNQKQD